MKTEVYDITGMHCAACSSAIERVTKKLNGVQTSEVNLPMNRLNITYDETLVNEEMICSKIKKAGFDAKLKHIDNNNNTKDIIKSNTNNEKITLIVSIILASIILYVSMGQMLFENIIIPDIFSIHKHPVNFAILQMVLAMLIMFLERKFFISGFTSLLHLNPNMDTLVAISSSVSFIYSFTMTLLIDTNYHAVHNLYYESSAIILALVSVGKYLESKNKEKTKSAIEKLIKLAPQTAILVDDNGQWEIPTDKVKVNDIILVQAGQNVPLDGIVIKGSGNINESMLTGESMPILKQENSDVIGGSLLISGVIYIKVTKIGNDTTLAQIVKFVEDAQGKKAPISKVADKVAGIFVPIVITIAFISASVWLISGSEFSFALKIFTTILVIACPCSLGLATPTSIIVGTGLSANHGILIRNGESLENTHKVNVAIFDKTGTLTTGSPVVTDIYSETLSEDKLLELVISVEKLSNHPLAKAICEQEKIRNLKIQTFDGEFKNIDGLGIIAKDLVIGNHTLMNNQSIDISNISTSNLSEQGKTVIYVAQNNKFIGYIAVSDSIKDSAIETINKLKEMNIKTIMLTGDNKKTANAIAKQVNVDEVIAEVLPTEKANIVKKYQDNNHTVMMIGDGINDAVALVQADIGCAIGNGSDIAIDSAQIILMKDNLLDVVKAIKISKYTIKNIKENLFWAFCYNCLCIPIAAGILYPSFNILLTPMIGGFAMSMSSLFVVGNALRLKSVKLDK